MLFRTYAIDPEAISSWDKYRVLVSPCGVSKGRIIANYPLSWRRMVVDACNSCSDVERKRIVTALEGMNGKLFDCCLKYLTEKSWIANACRESKGFDGVIGENVPGGVPNVYSSDDIHDDHDVWKAQIGPVARTEQGLVEVIEPLLHFSRKIKFIDPYFDPSGKQWRVFGDYFRTASKGRGLVEFEVHCQAKSTFDFFQEKAEELVCSAHPWGISDGVEVTFLRWHESGQERLHNRYLLTEFCGTYSQFGWDTGYGTTDIGLLSNDSFEHRKNDYSPETKSFQFCDGVRYRNNKMLKVGILNGQFVVCS